MLSDHVRLYVTNLKLSLFMTRLAKPFLCIVRLYSLLVRRQVKCINVSHSRESRLKYKGEHAA